MVLNFDHVTIVVTELGEAVRFFELLGFRLDQSVVIAGEAMDAYMGVPDLEADHVTLVLPGSEPRQEVQLLRYHHPEVVVDEGSGQLGRTGFNHVCFRVADLDATIERLVASGVTLRNEPMTFHERTLVFISGPGSVVVELAEWR